MYKMSSFNRRGRVVTVVVYSFTALSALDRGHEHEQRTSGLYTTESEARHFQAKTRRLYILERNPVHIHTQRHLIFGPALTKRHLDHAHAAAAQGAKLTIEKKVVLRCSSGRGIDHRYRPGRTRRSVALGSAVLAVEHRQEAAPAHAAAAGKHHLRA